MAIRVLIPIKVAIAFANSLSLTRNPPKTLTRGMLVRPATVNRATGINDVEGTNMSHWTTDTDLDPVQYRDPCLPPSTASIDDIRYAQQLRLQLRERYPDLPSPPPSFWCIGVD